MPASAPLAARFAALAALPGLLLGVAPVAGSPAAATVSNEIVRHQVSYLEDTETRPAIYAYTGRLTATNPGSGPVAAEALAEPARLDRDELVPGVGDEIPLAWNFAGRGVPFKINAQDDLGVHVLTPARADPYRTTWYHRQETATDFWSWGGVLAGSQVHGQASSENVVFGTGPRPVSYPAQDPSPTQGGLEWVERTVVETAATTQRDPVTGEDYTGVFAGAFAMPSLRVVGGDGVFTEDTQAPPVVVKLPVRPHGGVFFSTPPAPPGVEIGWSRTLDFDEQTLTITATVAAGSVWPESGVAADDETLPTWTWTPWVFFYGWDYGELVNGGPGTLAALQDTVSPSILGADGSLQAPAGLGPDALPELPAGLLEANPPPGTFFEAWTGERVHVGGLRLPTAPGVGPLPTGQATTDEASTATAPTAALTERDGVTGFAFGKDGQPVGELYVPHVAIDGEPHLLDDATVLDRFVHEPADPFGHGSFYLVSLHRVDGLFLSLLLEVSHASFGSHAGYYLWDAHSVDSASRTVELRVLLDPELNGGDANYFAEPFYTGSTYAEEAFVPQGMRNHADIFLHGWWGSFPAIEVRDHDGPGTIIHLQNVPAAGQSGHERASLASGAYLLADDGGLHPDPAGAIDPSEPIDGADVALVLVNAYEGTIWHRGGLQWFSWFQY